jgi:hypothetical protein
VAHRLGAIRLAAIFGRKIHGPSRLVAGSAQPDTDTARRRCSQLKLRSLLREYYPTLLATFEDLTSSDARATLGLAPTPTAASRLRRSSLRAALVRAGRQRNVERQVDRILAALRAE